MEGAFVNNNSSFSQAQTVLNWDPSSLEIKTRTVEKTLEPLVLQVRVRIQYRGIVSIDVMGAIKPIDILKNPYVNISH